MPLALRSSIMSRRSLTFCLRHDMKSGSLPRRMNWRTKAAIASRRRIAISQRPLFANNNSQVHQNPSSHSMHSPTSNPWSMPIIPPNIQRPHYSENGGVSPWKDEIPLAYPIGPDEWYDKFLAEGMRSAGRLAAESLRYAVSLVRPGITTRDIDRKITEWAFAHGCYPSSLNYGGFPGSICASVDSILSHGVPNEYHLFWPHLN